MLKKERLKIRQVLIRKKISNISARGIEGSKQLKNLKIMNLDYLNKKV